MTDIAEALNAAGVKVRALEWGDAKPPSKECSYDHADGLGPHHRYRIEWKSWKDYPGYTVDVSTREGWGAEHVASEDTLEAAKAAAQADYEARILAALTTGDQQ